MTQPCTFGYIKNIIKSEKRKSVLIHSTFPFKIEEKSTKIYVFNNRNTARFSEYCSSLR